MGLVWKWKLLLIRECTTCLNYQFDFCRLSLCKVTGYGCTTLASALRSDHCSLRDLDLSFNHLTDQGVKTLTEIQRDSYLTIFLMFPSPVPLFPISVDQNEQCWFDLRLLRQCKNIKICNERLEL